MTNSAKIKAHLLALANKEIEPVDNYDCIPNELHLKFSILYCDAVDIIHGKLKFWPEFSGCNYFPIPNGSYEVYCSELLNMYNPNDEYGAARLRACRWLSENWDTDFSEGDR